MPTIHRFRSFPYARNPVENPQKVETWYQLGSKFNHSSPINQVHRTSHTENLVQIRFHHPFQKIHQLGVSKNRGTPKWMVKIMENPMKMDDLEVPLFLETSNSIFFGWISGCCSQCPRQPVATSPVTTVTRTGEALGEVRISPPFLRKQGWFQKKVISPLNPLISIWKQTLLGKNLTGIIL